MRVIYFFFSINVAAKEVQANTIEMHITLKKKTILINTLVLILSDLKNTDLVVGRNIYVIFFQIYSAIV